MNWDSNQKFPIFILREHVPMLLAMKHIMLC